MPVFTPIQGEFLVALFTIGWGITVESWYVSRHTIWFNVVPLLVMMTTLELSSGVLSMLFGYVIVSILLVNATGRDGHLLKQIVGAKGYGSLALTLGLFSGAEALTNEMYATWFVVSLVVFGLWKLVRRWKTEDDF